jgi:hypothetical protein
MVHRPPRTFASPIVPNDAACLALHTALINGRRWCCVDDVFPGELPESPGELPDDECLPRSLESYFRGAWSSGNRPELPRASRVAERLRQLSASREDVLFICEWRLWPFVADAASTSAEPTNETDAGLHAAIVPEDPLLLWQTGYLDDLPALTLSAHAAGQGKFRKLECLRHLVSGVDVAIGRRLQTTLSPARTLLEPTLQERGPAVSTKLAATCLTYPAWGIGDLAAGGLPQFGLITGSGIEPATASFPLPDILGCERMYAWSGAEVERFLPAAEAGIRHYWGPQAVPPLTRSETAIPLSADDRWSVEANYRALALAAEEMRREARRIAPGLVTELHTPAVWVFRRECDGDHRSLMDVNAAYRRRVQFADPQNTARTIPVDGEQDPDLIHTISATRCGEGETCPGVRHDIASSIGLVYTGPECGPARYKAVLESGRPVPRTDPSCDPEIVEFDLIERSLAFCIKYATDTVLLAHYKGLRLTPKVENYAKKRGVRIIRMPLAIIPRHLQIAAQRRVFLTKTMRWHELGNRIADRMVFWRIPDPIPRRLDERLSRCFPF